MRHELPSGSDSLEFSNKIVERLHWILNITFRNGLFDCGSKVASSRRIAAIMYIIHVYKVLQAFHGIFIDQTQNVKEGNIYTAVYLFDFIVFLN